MTLLERDERMREEGREEGLKEGLKEGRAKEHLNSLRVLVRILTKYTENENDLLEEIMKHPEYSDITPDEIRAILEECIDYALKS
jgi:predicted transposase YdaD